MEEREARQGTGIMMSLPKQVFLVLGAAILIGAYPCATTASSATIVALLTGAMLSTANVLLGYAAIRHSIGRSTTTFMKFVLGGMGLRMAGMLAGFYLCVRVAGLPVIPLAGSLLSFYAVFLLLEIVTIHTQFTSKT